MTFSRRVLMAGGTSLPLSIWSAARRPAQAATEPSVLRATSRTLDINGRAATVLGLLRPDGGHGLVQQPGERFRVRLENQFPDIIAMCDALKARAYLLINRRSHKKVSFRLARLIAERQENQAFNQAGLFLSAIHRTPSLERRWVIDLDTPTQETVTEVAKFLIAANVLLAKVPTKTGVHFITAPFFKGDFNRLFPTVAILPDNLTLLYSKEEA